LTGPTQPMVPPTPVQAVELIQPPTGLTPQSPDWWVYSLNADLERRQALIFKYEDYYEGRHVLTFASTKFRETFGLMLAAIQDNWIPLVIQAATERLEPQGFLFGKEQNGDDEAWRIWQENSLDADCQLAFIEACKHGESYLLVWPDEKETPKGIFGRFFARRSTDAQVPRITVEHPSQMIVRRKAGDRRIREAAFKKWQEDDGQVLGTLYLPDSIHYYKLGDRWEQTGSGTNPLGVVPVVPLVNDPHMLPCFPASSLLYPPHLIPQYAHVGLGRSDMADAISTIDQVNKLLCDMMVASEMAAYRQRWATGLEVPRDPDTDEPIEPFKAAVDRLWIAEGEEGQQVKFGEFGATDLTNYTNAIEQRIQSLAARTRTPPHYLLGKVVNASGDALIAAEAGLSSKIKGKKTSFGEGLEEAVRLAFGFMEDDRADDMSAQIAWGQSEARSETQFVDALVKKLALGVPKEQLWADAGYSPQQIQRFKSMLLDEGITQNMLNPQSLGNEANPPARLAERGQQAPVALPGQPGEQTPTGP
jgi:hypothetical protein